MLSGTTDLTFEEVLFGLIDEGSADEIARLLAIETGDSELVAMLDTLGR